MTLENAGTLSFSLNKMLLITPSLAAAMLDCVQWLSRQRCGRGQREGRKKGWDKGREGRRRGEWIKGGEKGWDKEREDIRDGREIGEEGIRLCLPEHTYPHIHFLEP